MLRLSISNTFLHDTWRVGSLPIDSRYLVVQVRHFFPRLPYQQPILRSRYAKDNDKVRGCLRFQNEKRGCGFTWVPALMWGSSDSVGCVPNGIIVGVALWTWGRRRKSYVDGAIGARTLGMNTSILCAWCLTKWKEKRWGLWPLFNISRHYTF